MPDLPGFQSGFSYESNAQEVIFAPGSITCLSEAVERLGCKRLILCTNHSMRANGYVAKIQAALGDRIVGVYDQVVPHVQDVQVEEVLDQAVEKKVDAVIGMGGGSPIGLAKAVASLLAEKEITFRNHGIPVIAIPTTYAGSEMTAIYGITHTRESPARKVTVKDPRIAPRLVVYDPELTIDLPPEMTASSGINALAHCFEALYSITRNPLSTAAAISGVRNITQSLLRCYAHGDDLQARIEMQLGAYLAGTSLASVSMGLHHGLCHVLGGTANIPHGIANSIILPHAIRFNADATASLLIPAVEAMGISVNGIDPVVAVESAAQMIFDLIGQMKLPQRLRDVGVKITDLPRLAQIGYQNRTIHNNPKPITDASQIENILRNAW